MIPSTLNPNFLLIEEISGSYHGEEIGGSGTDEGREIGIEGEEIFEVDEESLGVIEKGFPVRETVLADLEGSDELLEFRHDGMGTDGGGVSGLRKLRLVAVVYCSFVPP